MKSILNPNRTTDTLLVRIGGWFEAHATGWGVAALVAVVGLLVATEIIKLVAA